MPENSDSDGTLIADVLSGKTERFAIIVNRYQRALLNVAKSRLGRDDWAEDVTQEAFLCAFKSLKSYDSTYSFRTWLWTILLNQCRRHYQKSQRKPQVNLWTDGQARDDFSLEQEALLESETETAESQLMAKEQTEKLERMFGMLPEAQADALRLRFYGGLKFQEIANAMGCSLSTAKNRVRWGLTAISEQLVLGEKE